MAHQTVDLKEREAFLAAWMIGTKLLHRRLEKSFKKSIHYFEHTRAGWVYEDLLLWDAIINKIMEFFFSMWTSLHWLLLFIVSWWKVRLEGEEGRGETPCTQRKTFRMWDEKQEFRTPFGSGNTWPRWMEASIFTTSPHLSSNHYNTKDSRVPFTSVICPWLLFAARAIRQCSVTPKSRS